MELKNAMKICGSGMRAEGERLKTIAENLANADSLAKTPGGDPYRRKVVSFKSELDRATGVALVKARKPSPCRPDSEPKYEPGHPAANAHAYAKKPSVKTAIEMADTHEGERTYEASGGTVNTAKQMNNHPLDLHRN